MYKTDAVCVYSDLDSYQAMLLDILDTDEAGMSGKIQSLYEEIQSDERVQSLLQKVRGWSPELSFYVLFSYDYFQHTHRFLGELLTQRPLTTYDALYTLLE
jgi:hypothetical protein